MGVRGRGVEVRGIVCAVGGGARARARGRHLYLYM